MILSDGYKYNGKGGGKLFQIIDFCSGVFTDTDFRSSLFLRSLLFTHFEVTQEAEILFALIFWHIKKEYEKINLIL